MIAASIDIGSNSLKLAIIRCDGNHFEIILQRRERLRLGADVIKNGVISPTSTTATVSTVTSFVKEAQDNGAESILIVGTAAIRSASNSSELISLIENSCGYQLEVLSPSEEARLIGISAVRYFKAENKSILNIDIGGGSTEIALFDGGKPVTLQSLPIGAVGLTTRFIHSDPPTSIELSILTAHVVEEIRLIEQVVNEQEWLLNSATSGTCMHISKLLGGSQTTAIELEALRSLNKRLSKMSLSERSGLTGISTHRAEVLLAGGIILETLMSQLKIKSLVPCEYSLKEGVLIDRLGL
jgi:exopolyphosphatase/guanosine-5'-triphosphate,3'-diphosphate pyrophosphatase